MQLTSEIYRKGAKFVNEQANKELQDIYDRLMDEIETVKKLHSLSGRPNKQQKI